jgi:hypothetical protein
VDEKNCNKRTSKKKRGIKVDIVAEKREDTAYDRDTHLCCSKVLRRCVESVQGEQAHEGTCQNWRWTQLYIPIGGTCI